jgi:hypothetical protein
MLFRNQKENESNDDCPRGQDQNNPIDDIAPPFDQKHNANN